MYAHLIFGIPGETDEQLIETARVLSEKNRWCETSQSSCPSGDSLEQIFSKGDFAP